MSGFSTCRSRGTRLLRSTLTLAVTVTAGLASTVDAVGADKPMSQYLRSRWGSEFGFPGGPIYAITQTAEGYLWIGAEKGLVRFDGLTFRLFEPGAAFGAGPAVLGVVAARDGSLWARLRGVALLRFQNGVFHNILPDVGLPASVISAMSQERNGDLLLATLGHGAVAYRNGRSEPIATEKDAPGSSFVISTAEASNGDIWLGTRDEGLLRVQGSRVMRLTDGLPDLKINCLLARDAGDVWIGTDRGIARWNGTEITAAGIPPALQRTATLQMIRDRDGNTWIAAGPGGLLRSSSKGVVRSASQAGSPPGHVATVFEDRDGNLWVGTDRGLERWRDPVFTTYSVAQGMPANSIGPVYPDDAGRVWFGPSSGGLFWIRDGVITRATQAGVGDDVVYGIDGGDGEVWIGRQRGGVTRLRLRGDAITAEHFTKKQGLAQDNVFAIRRTRDGTVWAATLSGGASLLKDGRFTTYDSTHGLASNTVTSILETRDGTMWFGTPNGLSTYSRGGWRTYVATDGLPSNDITALFEDRSGVIWVGTTKGIAVVQAGQTTPVAAELRGSILGFAEDRRGSMWINAADHVLSVDREALLHGILDDGRLREYGIADGLLGVESVKRNGTVVSDFSGHIWFALTSGLSVADPARAARSLPAVTLVEGVTADGAPLNLQGPVRISSSRRRLTFSYTGLSLSVPERVKYRYRLDGFDRAWSDPAVQRQAVYTNLAPGRYRFRVIASNSDGLWNGAEAALPIEIQPTFWQTSWFQLSVVVLTAVAGWGMYRLRMRQVARQLSVRFDERLAERTHIAQELHDTLLQGFLSASMQLHVAIDRLPDDSAAKSSLARVRDLMGRVIEEGRNAVRGLRSSTGTPHELEQAFARVQGEVGINDAACRVIVEGRPRSLKPIVRDEVYRIGREGLVNALRHSGATSIEIEVEYGSKELRVFVRDNGRGIDTDVIKTGSDGHWGIIGMRERAQRIGGTLKIRSRAAAGTEVELRIPAQVAY